MTHDLLLPLSLLIVSQIVPSTFAGDMQLTDWRHELEALGYLEYVKVDEASAETRVGTVRYDETRASPGLNLATYRQEGSAILFDMNGDVVYSWRADGADFGPWQHVELCRNGDLLVLVKDSALLRMTPSGAVRWIVRDRFHHDVTEASNGHIWAATRIETLHTLQQRELPVLEDRITELDANGKVIRHVRFEHHLLAQVETEAVHRLEAWASEHPHVLEMISSRVDHPTRFLRFDSPSDLFHLNAIEEFPREVRGLGSKGDLLISIRNLSLVGVLDPESSRLSWSWGPGVIEYQHNPTLLDGGNILIFDNGVRQRASRVVEVDPDSKRIVWEYRGTESEPFFSRTRGSSQRLRNGNTLICESDSGRSFEVTRDGDIVWEYLCPLISNSGATPGAGRAVFYRLRRLELDDAPGLATLKLRREPQNSEYEYQ